MERYQMINLPLTERRKLAYETLLNEWEFKIYLSFFLNYS